MMAINGEKNLLQQYKTFSVFCSSRKVAKKVENAIEEETKARTRKRKESNPTSTLPGKKKKSLFE